MGIFDWATDVFTGGSDSAAKTLKKGADKAQGIYDANYQKNKGAWDPYAALGAKGLSDLGGVQSSADAGAGAAKLLSTMGPGARTAYAGPTSFTAPDQGARPAAYKLGQFDYQASPGLDAQKKSIMDTVQKSAIAKGMLGGSNQAKLLTQGISDAVTADYGNQYERFLKGEDLGLKSQAQEAGQDYNNRSLDYNMAGSTFDRNVGRADKMTDRADNNLTSDRNFAGDQYDRDIAANKDDYDRILKNLGIGATATGAKLGLDSDYADTSANTITSNANTTAANTRNKYGAIGDTIKGVTDVGSKIAGFFF